MLTSASLLGAQDAAALAALEAQALRLADIASRLSSAAASRAAGGLAGAHPSGRPCAGSPSSASDTWSGPARLAFDAASVRLHRLLVLAEDQVEQALAETRRAITTIGGRR